MGNQDQLAIVQASSTSVPVRATQIFVHPDNPLDDAFLSGDASAMWEESLGSLRDRVGDLARFRAGHGDELPQVMRIEARSLFALNAEVAQFFRERFSRVIDLVEITVEGSVAWGVVPRRLAGILDLDASDSVLGVTDDYMSSIMKYVTLPGANAGLPPLFAFSEDLDRRTICTASFRDEWRETKFKGLAFLEL